jgi:hypothetical protein
MYVLGRSSSGKVVISMDKQDSNLWFIIE